MAPFFKNQERGACVHMYMHISLFLQKKKKKKIQWKLKCFLGKRSSHLDIFFISFCLLNDATILHSQKNFKG